MALLAHPVIASVITSRGTSVAGAESTTRPTRPHLRDILVQVAASVATAVLVPAAVLWTMLTISNFPTAVIAALAWMIAALSWRWATGRPVSGLLLLTLTILTIRTGLALVTGSAFLYFIQPVFADLTVATIFLGSLFSTRPVIARLAPDFYPLDETIAARPRMRSLFRRLTLMWGLVIVVKAGITLWLLESLSTAHFVLVKGGTITTLTLTTATVTVVWAVAVGRREGLLEPRFPAPVTDL